MVCRAGRGEEDMMWSELSWWVEEQGRGRNRAVTGSTWGGGRRRLVWRAGDACAMNQLSKYGPCSSQQHTHPLPVQSGWTSPLLPVYLSLFLSHVYCSTLLTVLQEACICIAQPTVPRILEHSPTNSRQLVLTAPFHRASWELGHYSLCMLQMNQVMTTCCQYV